MTALGWWYLVAVSIGGFIGGSLVYLLCSNKRNKTHYTSQTKVYSPIDNDKKEHCKSCRKN